MIYAQKSDAFTMRAYTRSAEKTPRLKLEKRTGGSCTMAVVFESPAKLINVLWSDNGGVWWLMEECRHEKSSHMPIRYIIEKEDEVREAIGPAADLLYSILMPYKMELL